MERLYIADIKVDDLQLVHIIEHIFMLDMAKKLEKANYSNTALYATIQAETFVNRFIISATPTTLHTSNKDRFMNVLEKILLSPIEVDAEMMQLGIKSVQAEHGIIFDDGKKIVEQVNKLMYNVHLVPQSSEVGYRKRTKDSDLLSGKLSFREQHNKFMITPIYISIEQPSIDERISLYVLLDVLGEDINQIVSKCGGYIYNLRPQIASSSNDQDLAIVIEARFNGDDLYPDDLETLLNNRLAELASKIAPHYSALRDYIGYPKSLLNIYNYLGVYGGIDEMRKMVTSQSIKDVISKLKVFSIDYHEAAAADYYGREAIPDYRR